MAENKKSWIGWAIGGVVLLAAGVGIYMFVKNRNKQKESTDSEIPPLPSQSSSSSTATTQQSQGIPFKNKTEGDAFRNWINDNYPNYAKQIQLDRSGSYNNSYIQKAWNDYGQAYIQAQAKPTSQASLSQGWGGIKPQMLDKNVWGNNSQQLTSDQTKQLRFSINVDGSKNVTVSFDINGTFRVYIGNFEQISTGTWSYTNGVYSAKLNDNSFQGSDNEISEMIKQILKLKFPQQMKYYSFSHNDLENDLYQSNKDYVDPQASML